MLDYIALIFQSLYAIYSNLFVTIAILAVVFTGLAVFASQACNPDRKWWRNPELPTDVCYALSSTVLQPYLSLPAAFLIFICLSPVMSAAEFKDFIQNGRGPLAGIGFGWQIVAFLIGYDFFSYWTHRGFHSAAMWRFHAIHHSSTDVDWQSGYRFHPVNTALSPCLVTAGMLALGISPEVPATLAAFDVVMSGLVHANLNWTFGTFKYVLASPVFHRWHHGPANDGGSMNFAATFPIFDVMFGTFFMPKDRLPLQFGVDDPNFPKTFLGQILYPLRPQTEPATATPAAQG